MIEYVKGDLLEAFKRGDVQVIAHQCNCFNSLAKGKARGIAGQIGKMFPEAVEADAEVIVGDKNALGSYTMARTQHGWIFNLYGQYRYGNSAKDGVVYTDICKLHLAMRLMRGWLDKAGMKGFAIGFPLIGCGLAGGHWPDVEKIIEEVFDGWNVKVYTL